jgi:hypothetical protein
MQEQPFILAVVPCFLRHPDAASASQVPDVSILSHLAPSSRVDLPDNHILVPASKSAPCISECRCPIRVYRNENGGLPACPIKMIQNHLSRAGELRVEASIRLVSGEYTTMLVILCLRVFILDAKKNGQIPSQVGHDDLCIDVAKDPGLS